MSGLGPTGTNYIWLPLDPIDNMFMGLKGYDKENYSNLWRSPIYALFSGISASDTFRVEVVSTWEYVPTLNFEAWAPSGISQVSTDIQREARGFIAENIPNLIRGGA